MFLSITKAFFVEHWDSSDIVDESIKTFHTVGKPKHLPQQWTNQHTNFFSRSAPPWKQTAEVCDANSEKAVCGDRANRGPWQPSP